MWTYSWSGSASAVPRTGTVSCGEEESTGEALEVCFGLSGGVRAAAMFGAAACAGGEECGKNGGCGSKGSSRGCLRQERSVCSIRLRTEKNKEGETNCEKGVESVRLRRKTSVARSLSAHRRGAGTGQVCRRHGQRDRHGQFIGMRRMRLFMLRRWRRPSHPLSRPLSFPRRSDPAFPRCYPFSYPFSCMPRAGCPSS